MPEQKQAASNPFVRACAEGRIEDVRRMIEAKADVNQIDPGLVHADGGTYWDGSLPQSMNRTGLQMAVMIKNLPLVKLLTEAGADPFLTQERSLSPVQLAVSRGFLPVLRYLVDEKSCPLVYDSYYEKDRGQPLDALLIEAIQSKECNLGMVKYLVEEKGLDPCYVGPRNTRPLTAAVDYHVSAEVLEYLLEQSARRGLTPNFACDILPLCSVLISSEAERNLREITGDAFLSIDDEMEESDKNSHTLLNIAISDLNIEKASMLLAHGADPLYKGGGDRTAFDVLKSCGRMQGEIAMKSEISQLLQAYTRPVARIKTAVPRKLH